MRQKRIPTNQLLCVLILIRLQVINAVFKYFQVGQICACAELYWIFISDALCGLHVHHPLRTRGLRLALRPERLASLAKLKRQYVGARF